MQDEPLEPPVDTLIVDDVERLRTFVADELADVDRFRVVGEAADGAEAVEQACSLEPDLVLLDLSMPRMDGLEALTEIRREVPGAEVVVLSGFRSERMEALVSDHGALAYIEKGLGTEELLRELDGFFENGHQPDRSEGRCEAAEGADEGTTHLHVVGLDDRTPKELTQAVLSARPGWKLTHHDGRPSADQAPETVDAIVVTVEDCGVEWSPTVCSLASRHPETPIVVGVPNIPEGCLAAALEAGAVEVVDLETADPETLANRVRWAILVADRHGDRTRRLEMLAGTMAHDLRQPLRALERYAGWVQEGLETGDADRVDTALDGLRRGVDRARRLIDGQLTYARLRTRPPPAHEVDPEEAIEEACADLRERIDRAEATIEVGPLPSVLAPPEQLTVLFRNLVSNAIKYRAEGQAPSVEIEGDRDGETVLISVRDDGIGIDPDYQDEIFDPFRRLHTEQDYPGTGLGLAICREIVEQQGGSIEVDAEPGEGTVFTVRLPAAEP